MRNSIVLILVCLAGCGPVVEDCTSPLFPYPAVDPMVEPTEIPVCPWTLDTYGCGTFEGMTLENLQDFCNDTGAGLARDEIEAGGIRTDYCYTCD